MAKAKEIGHITVREPDGETCTAYIQRIGCSCSGNNQKIGRISDPRINFMLRVTVDEAIAIMKRKNERRDKMGWDGRWKWNTQYYG